MLGKAKYFFIMCPKLLSSMPLKLRDSNSFYLREYSQKSAMNNQTGLLKNVFFKDAVFTVAYLKS